MRRRTCLVWLHLLLSSITIPLDQRYNLDLNIRDGEKEKYKWVTISGNLCGFGSCWPPWLESLIIVMMVAHFNVFLNWNAFNICEIKCFFKSSQGYIILLCIRCIQLVIQALFILTKVCIVIMLTLSHSNWQCNYACNVVLGFGVYFVTKTTFYIYSIIELLNL